MKIIFYFHYEKKQLLETSQTHVAGLEEEIEELREALDESVFEYKNFHKQSVDHVVEVRKKITTEAETRESSGLIVHTC